VRLERNYRSTGPIVETANRLMRGRAGALRLESAAHEAADEPADAATGRRTHDHARRAAAGGVEPEPELLVYADELAEARGVATRIRDRIDQGVPAETIAVLLRVNSQSALLEQALGEVGVAARVRGAQRFFDQPEVREAVHALRAAALAVTGEPLFKSVSDVLRSLGWTVQAPDGPGAVRARWESLNAIARLVDDAPEGTTFREFADDLRARAEAHHEPAVAAVTLATLHSAKGLEWDEVYLVGLTEGMLPIAYAKGLDAIDEERRLLYVGITRARNRLALSWAAQGQRGQNREPSRVLEELRTSSAGAGAARRRLALSWARASGAHRGEREPSRFLQELSTRTRDAARAGATAGARPVVRDRA
jgi:DNA helicase-2/ATP-dependent DNA helicase PcrA